MSFIEMPGLGDIKEQRIADENTYDLIITAKESYAKTPENERVAPGTEGFAAVMEDALNYVIHVTIAFDGEPDLQPFSHWVTLPVPLDEPDKVKGKIRRLKRFLLLTKTPFDQNGFDEDDLFGATFSAFVTSEEMTDRDNQPMTDGSGAPRFVNRLIVPRFKED